MIVAVASDPFVAQLAEICRKHPTRAKWVIVRSPAIGHALGERLALSGSNWANLRFLTPFALALETAAPILFEQGFEAMPDGRGPGLVMRLLLELPAGTPRYFVPLADQPTMGEALWATIRELRLAGVTAAELPAPAFEDERKHGELTALVGAYETHLAGQRQADAADVYRAAAANIQWAPVGAKDLLVETPAIDLPPLARAFVDMLPGQHVRGRTPDIPGLDVPRRHRQEAEMARQGSRLSYLLEPRLAPSPTDAEWLELFHAAGKEAEVEAVLRRILAPRGPGVAPGHSTTTTPAAPLPLDRVEIACASPEYAHLFWEKAQRLDLPVTIEQGVPAAFTAPARAVLAFCDWVESDFVAGRLRRLFQAGDVRIEFPDGAAGGQAARLLLRAEATSGRETYDRSLSALAARYRASAECLAEDDHRPAQTGRAAVRAGAAPGATTDAATPGAVSIGRGTPLSGDDERRAEALRKAARAEYLRTWIGDLLVLAPMEDAEGAVSLADLVKGARTFLERHVAIRGLLDAAAAAGIDEALDNLLTLGDLRRPVRDALAFVRSAVEGLSVAAARARPGSLHISVLPSAGYAGRPFTFVVGLQEGGVFSALLEDPVLLDAERTGISPWLPTSHDRLAESVHDVLSRLAVLDGPAGRAEGAEGGVWFSCSCRDLREGRETFPSWLMLQALRVKNGQPGLTYDDLREHLGTPETAVPAAPDEALADAGWWLRTMKQAGEGAARAVFRAFPALAAGRTAAEARESARFTEWDGFVQAAGQLLDPRTSGRRVSATRLEALVKCPFRYFVEHGLGLEVVADEDPDQDQWLDALQRGSALHDVYATLGREARARGARLDPRRDVFRGREVAAALLNALRADFPPPSEVVFDRERADFLRDVDLFLEFEASRPDSEPLAFEVSFGRDLEGDEPLAQADPVRIPLGQGQSFLLAGTIDRIDRLPDGTYEVIDYKSGTYDPDDWHGTFRGTAMLQHALYGVAATALLRRIDAKARVARAVYDFPSARGGGERVLKPPPGRAALADVLSNLFDVIAAGTWISTDDKKECRYCDFSRTCGRPLEQARRKFENPENTCLHAYRALRERP